MKSLFHVSWLTVCHQKMTVAMAQPHPLLRLWRAEIVPCGLTCQEFQNLVYGSSLIRLLLSLRNGDPLPSFLQGGRRKGLGLASSNEFTWFFIFMHQNLCKVGPRSTSTSDCGSTISAYTISAYSYNDATHITCHWKLNGGMGIFVGWGNGHFCELWNGHFCGLVQRDWLLINLVKANGTGTFKWITVVGVIRPTIYLL